MNYIPEPLRSSVNKDPRISEILEIFDSRVNECKSFSEFLLLEASSSDLCTELETRILNVCNEEEKVLYNITQWKYTKEEIEDMVYRVDGNSYTYNHLVALSHLAEMSVGTSSYGSIITSYILNVMAFFNIIKIRDLLDLPEEKLEYYKYTILRTLVNNVYRHLAIKMDKEEFITKTNKLKSIVIGRPFGNLWDIEFSQVLSEVISYRVVNNYPETLEIIKFLTYQPMFFNSMHNYGCYNLYLNKMILIGRKGDREWFIQYLKELVYYIDTEYNNVPGAIRKFNIYDKCNLRMFMCIIYFAYRLLQIPYLRGRCILELPKEDEEFLKNGMVIDYNNTHPAIDMQFKKYIDDWFSEDNKFYIDLLERK